MFGCGGDRDRDKRPLMGEIAARLADALRRHLRQPALGGPGGDHRRDPRRDPRRRGRRRGSSRAGPARGDRARARRGAQPGDTVVIAGKGHEQGQEFEGGRKIPFDDREVAGEELPAAPQRVRGVDRAAPRADRGRGRRRGRPRRRAAGARRARWSTRARCGPGDLFFGLPRRARRRRRVRRGGARGGRLGRGGRAGTCALADRAAELGGARLGARAPTIRWPRSRALARAWRRELGCRVVGITGSVGKTSVKDICHAILPMRVHASPENFNTEIGLPLAILAAPPETEALVLEMAMRGRGQIAELCEIAEPDVGGDHQHRPGPPGAARHAGGDRRGQGRDPRRARATAAARWSRPTPRRSSPTSHEQLVTITFGARRRRLRARGSAATEARSRRRSARRTASASFEFPFAEAHNLAERPGGDRDRGGARGAARRDGASGPGDNLLAPARRADRAARRDPSLVNDCYNANPISMRAALDHLASLEATGRRVAVLGEMARARPGRAPATTARSAPTRASSGSGRSSGSASSPATTRRTRGRPTPRRRCRSPRR